MASAINHSRYAAITLRARMLTAIEASLMPQLRIIAIRSPVATGPLPITVLFDAVAACCTMMARAMESCGVTDWAYTPSTTIPTAINDANRTYQAASRRPISANAAPRSSLRTTNAATSTANTTTDIHCPSRRMFPLDHVFGRHA